MGTSFCKFSVDKSWSPGSRSKIKLILVLVLTFVLGSHQENSWPSYIQPQKEDLDNFSVIHVIILKCICDTTYQLLEMNDSILGDRLKMDINALFKYKRCFSY